MSDAEQNSAREPKAVEEVASTSEAALATSTDAAATPADEVAKSDDKPAEEAEASDDKKEAKEEKAEPKEITHGLLSKAHGGLLAFFKIKRFFYFQDEPIAEDKLKTYLSKDNASKDNAAYASQTGKGLLIYSKTEAQKDIPHGIIKLADVTEVTSAAQTKFILKLASGDLHFEAPAAERDSWVHTLKAKIAEAKEASNEITESEGYKAALEKFTKSAPAQASKAPEKPADKPADTKDKEPETEESKPETADKTEATPAAGPSDEEAAEAEKKEDIKRNPSKKGKRQSFLPFLRKKEEPEEKKEEAKKEEPKKEEAKKEEAKKEEAKEAAETAEATEQSAEAAPAAASAEASEGETKPAEEADKAAEPAASPKVPPKRHSFLGGLFRREPVEEKKEVEPVKEAADEEVAAEEGEAKATEAPAEGAPPAESSAAASSPKEKRKSSFFPFSKKSDVKSDTEDDAKSPSTSPPSKNILTGVAELVRKASKSGRTGKEPDHKDVVPPDTVPETEEPAPAGATTAAPTTVTEEATPAASEPATTSAAIGDVVPDAVTVGSTPPLQAAA